MSFCRSRINLLTLFAPSVDPCSLSTREGITAYCQDLTHTTCTKCMQPFAVHVIGNIERGTLFDDIERTAITLQFTLTGAKGLYLFAVLVIDVVPVLRCFDMAYALCLEVGY